MNKYRGKDGTERIWINPAEIEEMMSTELILAELMPSKDHPVVNLESFVEHHLKVQFDPYARLDATVLGETEFHVGNRIKISINQDLTSAALDDDDSAPGILGRWRATVAHEASHVLMHRCLFDLSSQQYSLFDSLETEKEQPKLMQKCLKRDVQFGTSGSDWKEVQANMGMACLLMPKSLFVAEFLSKLNQLGMTKVEQGSALEKTLILHQAEKFQVSKQAASIRILSLQLVTKKGERTIL